MPAYAAAIPRMLTEFEQATLLKITCSLILVGLALLAGDAWAACDPPIASVGSGDVRRGFTGHELDDEFGLVNMGGRIYDPETARFLTPDPFVQFPHDGQSYNRYAYVLNNPLRWVDPTGFQTEDDELPLGGETIVRAPRLPEAKEELSGAAEWGEPPKPISHSADQNGMSSLEAQHKAIVLQQPGNLPRYMAQHGLAQPTLLTFHGTEHERQMARFEQVRLMTGKVVEAGLTFVVADLLARGTLRLAGGALRAAIIDGAMALRAEATVGAGWARSAVLGGGCFVAGTPVLALAGPLPIEQLRAGDWVWAWDEETQASGWHQVSRTFVKPERAVLRVELASNDGETAEVLGVTAEHPFWVRGKGWTQAQHLEFGDAVETAAGNPVWVYSLQTASGLETVYNIEVERAHTYFVGELSAWVHNISSVSAAGGAGSLAARFGTTAERVAVLDRAITAEGGLNTSATVARQLAGQRSYIPTQSILDTLGSGARVADPQGVAGQFMYRSAASFNGPQGTLEVLVHEASGQIRHVLFRSGVAP